MGELVSMSMAVPMTGKAGSDDDDDGRGQGSREGMCVGMYAWISKQHGERAECNRV